MTLGFPVRPLLWVSKSRDKLAGRSRRWGTRSAPTRWPSCCPTQLGFSRQHNRKADEGSKHPDRERAIRAHQRESRRRAGRRSAGHLGRHEEEGAGRQLQERRLGLSPEGRSAAREGARLRGQGAGQGRAVRRLRRDGQRRLGQRRHHHRHGRVRGAVDPPLARAHGPRSAIRR